LCTDIQTDRKPQLPHGTAQRRRQTPLEPRFHTSRSIQMTKLQHALRVGLKCHARKMFLLLLANWENTGVPYSTGSNLRRGKFKKVGRVSTGELRSFGVVASCKYHRDRLSPTEIGTHTLSHLMNATICAHNCFQAQEYTL
jgi:hypothetical protein